MTHHDVGSLCTPALNKSSSQNPWLRVPGKGSREGALRNQNKIECLKVIILDGTDIIWNNLKMSHNFKPQSFWSQNLQWNHLRYLICFRLIAISKFILVMSPHFKFRVAASFQFLKTSWTHFPTIAPAEPFTVSTQTTHKVFQKIYKHHFRNQSAWKSCPQIKFLRKTHIARYSKTGALFRQI